ncbi:efflux RND transporter periplasmic adaptor subunit [Lysobacter enzymogenes]|uniref:Efflux RND transporter periplasmic adaptor subunit n=1 Tax=Lysobacter enzymogenes TaxID=69 RepID=A0A3N2RAP4_LYSEN|nr:efflux RND transporter periplasmic adaptor subunit [Lysobacter enzymogenes]ROU04550.1 efflux RND transporter periplasmic adaptor subunit [Lysobacter enzymogenes]
MRSRIFPASVADHACFGHVRPAGRFPFAGGSARLWPAAALVLALSACGGAKPAAEDARPVLVAKPGGAVAAISAYAGEVRAREESPLSFRVGGKLVERKVDVGAHVAAGQVLAVLDPGDLDAQTRAAQAQLAAAEAEYARARADQVRYDQLAKDQLVSRSTKDAQDAQAKAAQGQLNSARANWEVARNQSGYTQLRAPAAGVIASRAAEAGQVVAAGQQVFALAADGAREVAFAVPEGVIAEFKPGQQVQVELWSIPGKRWPGRVREVAPAADPASRTYAARVTVDAPAGTLELGQSARIYQAAPAASGLSVPLAAVQQTGQGRAVFVADPRTGTVKLKPVTTGPYGPERVPVRSGLGPDDWVVVAGGHLLRDGQKVAPVDRENHPVER